MSYRIPEELINRRDVQIYICGLSNDINISFSDRYSKEFAKWPKKKVKALMYNINTDITYTFYFNPIWPDILDKIYDRVYVSLRQSY